MNQRFTFLHQGMILFLLLCNNLPRDAQATLIEYNNGLVYDNILNITWYIDTNTTPSTKEAADNWAAQLEVSGYDDWRLPSTPDGTWGYNSLNNLTKYNVTTSELGHLFYVTLENIGKYDSQGIEQTGGYGLQHQGPFTTLISGSYWFGTGTTMSNGSNDNAGGWIFDFANGSQFKATLNTLAYGIAVRDGNPINAPEPATALLFLLGIPLLTSRKK